jgi:tetraacyldisaccharide 4'-kinase
MYRSGLKKRDRAEIPVICVGNITTGGTGKTPMVCWVVDCLRQAGRNPAILTRGYKSREGKSEEAELLRSLCGVEVIVNPDRVKGAHEAVQTGADVIVMDDGFQHLRLARDLDIVLIDATAPFGGRACLPAGRLREPLSGLRRARILVITRSDQVGESEIDEITRRLSTAAPDAMTALAMHEPVRLVGPDGEGLPPSSLEGRKAFLFCGLGNPEAFFRTAGSLGADIVGSTSLPDHAHYTPPVVESLNESAKQVGAQIVLTTSKDAVKIDAKDFDLPLHVLDVRIKITRGEDQVRELIFSTVR